MNHAHKALWVGLALLAAVATTHATALPAAGSAEHATDIAIKDFAYAPRTLRIRQGTTVTWVNHDEETHTITATTGAFASTGLGNDETFSQTFTRPGSYEYFCALHPKMRATVIVK